MTKLTFKKEIVRNERMMSLIKVEHAPMYDRYLPIEYLCGYPRFFWGQPGGNDIKIFDGSMNGLNLLHDRLYPEEYIDKCISLLQEAGDRLHNLNGGFGPLKIVISTDSIHDNRSA